MLGETQYDYTVKTQTMLNNLGYGPLDVDGKWGPKTESAWQHYAADAQKIGQTVKKQTNFPTADSTTGQPVLKAATGKASTAQPGANTPWYAQLLGKYLDMRYAPQPATPTTPPRVAGGGAQGGGGQYVDQQPFYTKPAFLITAALGVGALIFFTRKKQP